MEISRKGVEYIRALEGNWGTTAKVERISKVVHIGHGQTYYSDGSKVQLGDVRTKEFINTDFLKIVKKYASEVNSAIRVPVKQYQFDALVAFHYNCSGAFANKTIPNLINAGKSDAEIVSWWKTHYITAGGNVQKELITRRLHDSQIWQGLPYRLGNGKIFYYNEPANTGGDTGSESGSNSNSTLLIIGAAAAIVAGVIISKKNEK